jgi:hypothetical protein
LISEKNVGHDEAGGARCDTVKNHGESATTEIYGTKRLEERKAFRRANIEVESERKDTPQNEFEL